MNYDPTNPEARVPAQTSDACAKRPPWIEAPEDRREKEIATLRARCEAAEKELEQAWHNERLRAGERDGVLSALAQAERNIDHERAERDAAIRNCEHAQSIAKAAQERVGEQADVIAMHERDLLLCIDERNAAQDRIANLVGLLRAVRATEFDGIQCDDVGGKNWFDARDAAIDGKVS